MSWSNEPRSIASSAWTAGSSTRERSTSCARSSTSAPIPRTPSRPRSTIRPARATRHIYVSQTDRGEVLIGAEIEPYTTYSQHSTIGFLEQSAHHTLELLPILAPVKVLRAWAGLCDITPDYSPIMGKTEVDGFFV